MTRLHQLSRGWPAGLKLLLQLPQVRRPANLHAGTAADQAALFAYLAGEIFEQQPAAVRRILLELAHFPRMSARHGRGPVRQRSSGRGTGGDASRQPPHDPAR
jgi:ATP/maltotriose-dependent transcriptional regulator MalT